MHYCYRGWLIHYVVKSQVKAIPTALGINLVWVKNNVVKDANDPADILLHFALLYVAYGIGRSSHRSCFAAIVLATALRGEAVVKVFSIPNRNYFLLVMGVKNNYGYYDPAINSARIYS